MNLALNNVYCANTHPPSVILGLAHGSYGLGGIIAPIAGTALVSHGILWSRFYFLAVALRICCIGFAGWAFWSYSEDSEPTLLTALEATSSRQTAAEDAANKFKELKVALKNKVTIFGALFIFAYQGAEVSISGWIISYLINYRDGDPAKVGYVTAGFWVCPKVLLRDGQILMLNREASHSAASYSRTQRQRLAKRTSSSCLRSALSHFNSSPGSFQTLSETPLRCLCSVFSSDQCIRVHKQSSHAYYLATSKRRRLASSAAQEVLEVRWRHSRQVYLLKLRGRGCCIRFVWACMLR